MNPRRRLLLALLATILLAAGAAAQVPQINQPLVPAAAAPEGSGFTLTVNGTGFMTDSVVNWNGSRAQATTFVSSTKLLAAILSGNLELPSTAAVTVINPTGATCNTSRGTFPCAAQSNVVDFEITTPKSAVSFTRTDYPAGATAYSIVRGDFNGDGLLDLAVPNFHDSTISIFLGNGDGTFQPAVNYAVGPYPASVAVGDFNGDGHLDLVVTNQFSATVSVLLGNGNGTFQAAVNYSAGWGPVSVAVGDLNGDGKLDLAIANFNTNSVSILLGNGDGTFQGPATYTVGQSPARVAIADFNADGKLDLVVANAGNNNVNVLLGNGDGSFQQPLNSDAGGHMSSISVADFNGDGNLDLVVAHSTNSVSVLLGKGDGTFQAPADLTAGSYTWWATVADLNGDGIPDIAVANAIDNTVSIFLGNGDGTFQNQTTYSVGTQPFGVVAGDFNGDGRLDLAVNDAGSNSVSILMQPTPTFGGYAQLTGGNVFSGNQTINGTVSATSFIGDGSLLTGIVASTASSLDCIGCILNKQLGITYALGDAQGGNAINALNFGGLGPSAYAPATGSANYVAKTGDTMSGILNLPTDGLNVGGSEFILTGGMVGIGTNPTGALSVSGPVTIGDTTIPGQGFPLANGALMIGSVNTAFGVNTRWSNNTAGLLMNSTNYTSIKVHDVGVRIAGAMFYDGPNNAITIGRDEGYGPLSMVLLNGNVGIGTTTPTANLEVNGSAKFDGPVTFAAGQTYPGSGTITGITAGSGLSGGGTTGNVTLTNTGVLSVVAGTGISTSGTAQNPVLNNTASTMVDGTTITNSGTTLNPSLAVGVVPALQVSISPNLRLGGQTPPNTVFAGPASGNGQSPMFRPLVAADIPPGSGNYIQASPATAQAAGINLAASTAGSTIQSSNTSTAVGSSGVLGTGRTGVQGNGSAYGVQGAGSVAGVYATGTGFGVQGTAVGFGVWGNAGTTGTGVYGFGNVGVQGQGSNYGVYGTGSNYGVYGNVTSVSGFAGVFDNAVGKILSLRNNGVERVSVDPAGNVTTTGNVTASGNLTSAGSVSIGGGTAIAEYISTTYSATLPALTAGSCQTFTTAALSGFTPGASDTIALGIPGSLVSSLGNNIFLMYQAWETTTSASPTITIQVCNPTGSRYAGGATGTIRIDVFKH